MQKGAIIETLRDARGSVKTIGQLVSVCAADLKIRFALAMGDRLAVRAELQTLAQAMGWHVTPSWLIWATKAQY